ncbi:PREDICTED: probable inactive purple acid phosphatase 2 [Nelumbo nucifera]|uniref:Purple acid phosphatase n=2 Tax=Nelumbo nucifera TaxID=4432 RepID=A0A1U7ZWL1_NELNU|nr:PREDICTED: probable inactive purple acid phosphatase 2 [Nelumbo nucifera]DAD31413.1 TPA_asm: hypothetical protein HUJ06_010264 [Nelumbo nucifera]
MAPSRPLLCFLFISTFLAFSSSSPVSISFTPQTLSKSGDVVNIQWAGIEMPSNLDWLGIYSPPDSTDDNFIGYVHLSTCDNWETGSGSIDLPLVNIRSNYEFRIFKWMVEKDANVSHPNDDSNPLPMTKHLLAKSEELSFESGHGPEQIHLSFTEEDDEMRVMFITPRGEVNHVKYGEDEDNLDKDAVAEVKRYQQSDMCHSPANDSIGWRDPGFVQDAIMKNLKKGRRYYYKVGNDGGGWSETQSFMSRDEDSEETTAFIFGDMGTATPYTTFRRTQEESKLTMKWVLRDIENLGDKPAFVSHIGDISYARGHSWLWDTFFTQIEPVASKVPYLVCIGNHDYDWPSQPWIPDWAQTIYKRDSGGECGVPYSFRFNMPGNASVPTGTDTPPTRNVYYSVDVGVVHFLYISTETNFLPGGEQYDFIKQDLERVDRQKTPFVVVQGHRPMYTTGSNFKDSLLREKMLENLEPVFVKHKVDLILWGHVHRYERFCPMKNFTCGEGLPLHVVVGMGGQDWQPVWAPLVDHPKDPIFPQPDLSLYRSGEFGYTRLHATRKKLTLTYVGNHDGETHDMVEIPAPDAAVSAYGEERIRVAPAQDTDDAGEPVKTSVFVKKAVSGGAAANVGEPALPWYVKVGSMLVVGGFVGCLFGFISRARREAAAGSRMVWSPIDSSVGCEDV